MAVSSGTAALDTALHALALPRGSEVILPTFTMIACLTAVLRNDLKPVLVDADARTWCMDVDQVAARISPRTAAIMAVHIYGHPADMGALAALAGPHGPKLVEDAAEAHGARYRGRPVGGFGQASAFSFYSNKIVTTGEGGMVLCDDEAVAERCRRYRNMYFDPEHRYVHEHLGQTHRLTNVQAAIGCVQVDKLPETLRRKARVVELYDRLLADVPDVQLPPRTEGCDNVHWAYGLVLGDTHALEAPALRARLRAEGVDSRLFFRGMHEQPAARELGLFLDERFPVAERLARRGLYLPSGPTLTEAQVEQVARALARSLGLGRLSRRAAV